MVLNSGAVLALWLLFFVILPRTASFYYKNSNNIRNSINTYPGFRRKLMTEQQAGQTPDLEAALKDLKEFDDACT